MPKGLSPRQFALDLKKFGKVTQDQARLIFQKIVLDLDTRIVLGTPVDTGRARGSWFSSVNVPSNDFSHDQKDRSGKKVISSVASTKS